MVKVPPSIISIFSTFDPIWKIPLLCLNAAVFLVFKQLFFSDLSFYFDFTCAHSSCDFMACWHIKYNGLQISWSKADEINS